MAFLWRADDGPTLNAGWLGSFVIFQGIQTSIAKKPYIFVIFQGGGGGGGSGPLVPPSGPPHAISVFCKHDNGIFLHIRLGFPLFLHILENSISHTQYQPVGKIKIKQPNVERQVTSYLCLNDIIMLCRISAHSGTSGSGFF